MHSISISAAENWIAFKEHERFSLKTKNSHNAFPDIVRMKTAVSTRFISRLPARARILTKCPLSSVASSTMDLVDMECTNWQKQQINSTLQYVVDRDYEFHHAAQEYANKSRSADDDFSFRLQWKNLVEAYAVHTKALHLTACEMDLIEAAERRNDFDKILLLIHHGEAGTNVTENSPLTQRGTGQTLNLSRRTSLFCNHTTGLQPDVIVVAPMQRAIQTALLALPQYAPHSVRARDWVCHPAATVMNPRCDFLKYEDEQQSVVDFFSIGGSDAKNDACSSELEMLERTECFLNWVQGKPGRVFVGTFL